MSNRKGRRAHASQVRRGQMPSLEEMAAGQRLQAKQMRAQAFEQAVQNRQVCQILVEEADSIIGAHETDDPEELAQFDKVRADLKLKLKGARAVVIERGLEYLDPPEERRIIEPTDSDVAAANAEKTGLIVTEGEGI